MSFCTGEAFKKGMKDGYTEVFICNTKLSFFFQKKKTNSMMAVKKLVLLYIRNEMIRGLTWTGSGVEGLSVEHLHPQTSLEGPPWDDVYVTIFTYFASIEVGLYFHEGALSNLLANITHYGSCQLICPNILDCARYSGRINSSTFCSQVFLPL